MTPGTNETIMNVPPSALLADDNSRFGLRKSRIEQLKTEIMEKGEIIVPLDVERLSTPQDGVEFRIVDGHYRRECAVQLNKEVGAGLLLPIRIHDETDKVTRLKRQVSLNLQREDPSPMDMATAISQLFEEGVSRQDVRAIFRRSGGRKGDKVQDASNAYLNMMVSFLDFPKKIQNLIHERIIGTAAAYTLTKKPKGEWDNIVEKCMQDRENEAVAEEKAEEKLLEADKKAEEAKLKSEQLIKDKAAADEKLKLTAANLQKYHAEEVEKFAAAKNAKNNEEKKQLEEAFKAAQGNSKAALEAAQEAEKEAKKLQVKMENLQKAAAERAKKLADSRKAADKSAKSGDGKKPIGPKAIDKAANDVVKLTGPQMRQAVHEWALPGSFPKIKAIFEIVEQCFDSVYTPSQAYTLMGKITGESTKPNPITGKIAKK